MREKGGDIISLIQEDIISLIKQKQKQDCLVKVGASWLSQPGQRHNLWQPGGTPGIDH